MFERGLRQSSGAVNALHFAESIYTVDEPTAHRYFGAYFQNSPFTPELRANLGYPLFHWGNNHRSLQKGLSQACLDSLRTFFERNPSAENAEAAFATEPTTPGNVFQSLCLLADIALHTKALGTTDLDPVRDELFAILQRSQLCERGYVRLEPDRFPCLNAVLAQFLATLSAYYRLAGDVTPLADLLMLEGPRRELLTRHSVLAVDNMGFDAAQLQAIDVFMTALPVHARLPVTIFCFDFILSSRSPVSIHSFVAKPGFNVFPTRVGASVENQFPDDYGTVYADQFCIALAHEYAHNLDSLLLQSHPVLQPLRERLLAMAGQSRNNYLRSNVGDGYFAANPGEFVASIANQFFCDTARTLDYALSKYHQGNANQINQFLLLASVLSDCQSATFFRIGEGGSITSIRFPVKKHDDLIEWLSVDRTRYSFNYSNGVVQRVQVDAA
jgi:hypothetical protein